MMKHNVVLEIEKRKCVKIGKNVLYCGKGIDELFKESTSIPASIFCLILKLLTNALLSNQKHSLYY